MTLERIKYRAGQFREAILIAPEPTDLELAGNYLNSAQMALFSQMQPSEQAHSLRVFKLLLHAHEEDHDLLVAALLHDVGKSRYPLSLWERVTIVILKSIFPNHAREWGLDTQTRDTDPKKNSWRRPFIVAEQHPRWGAEMASAAGATPLTASLILKHQTTISADPAALEDRLLLELQAADSAC